MIAPVAVETSTSRRQRARWNAAKCWATPPPQEMPSTSTWSWPSSVSSLAISMHSPVKRYGAGAGAEPPIPGGSNLITSTAGSSSRTNGSSSSRLAPMPLISSSGTRSLQPGFWPGRTATRSSRPLTMTLRTSAVVYIGSRRGALYRVVLAAERARALAPPAAPAGQPGRVVRPPGAVVRRRLRNEFIRVRRIRRRGAERRLGVARRVDQGRDVPACGQHEPDLPAEQLRRAVARLPRADVVGGAGDQVGVHVDLGQVDRRAEH